MPLLDVSELMTDVDFCTAFDLIRSASSVDANGNTVLTPVTTVGMVGIVQPATSNELRRLPDMEQTRGALTIYAKFDFVAGAVGFTADVVLFPSGSNNRYTVTSVDDWSQWGQGYRKATLTQESLLAQ